MTMETPVQIDFQGMESTAQLQEAVGRQLAGLEDKFGRITAGRIVIKARASTIAPAANTISISG
jgi:hypothetical protein